MSTQYTNTAGGTPVGVSINHDRRIFNFGERIHELSPQESVFFSMLSRYRKQTTDDPVFKFMEQRHQWQRRNFAATAAVHGSGGATWATVNGALTFNAGAKYDKYGRTTSGYNMPGFILPNQVLELTVELDTGEAAAWQKHVLVGRVTSVTPSSTNSSVALAIIAVNGFTDFATQYTGKKLRVVADAPGQVIGSAFAEATGAPTGWKDELYTNEGYTQIFKTAIPLFSGSSLATRYRGIASEYRRVWGEKLLEHKMDINTALLFGVGRYEVENGTEPKRYSWGLLPYTERHGKVYNFSYTAANPYDRFLEIMEDFMRPEEGNSRDKLVLTSRKFIGYLNKIGDSGFLKNTVGSTSYRLDVQNIQNEMGHEVMKVRTVFGNLHFIEEPLFRGVREDYVLMADLKNVAVRPLAANGENRDTKIFTNVQDNDMDGRKDMILTELGLEIALPETHAIIKCS